MFVISANGITALIWRCACVAVRHVRLSVRVSGMSAVSGGQFVSTLRPRLTDVCYCIRHNSCTSAVNLLDLLSFRSVYYVVHDGFPVHLLFSLNFVAPCSTASGLSAVMSKSI